MITLKDIAEKSGFSIPTISKALNNYKDISVSTKKKILDLCDDMGYIPNLSARSLVTHKSNTIGIILEDVTSSNILLSEVFIEFRKVIEVEGYDILFLSKNMTKFKGAFLQHALRKQVEAIFVLSKDTNTPEILEVLRSNIPTVSFDGNGSGEDYAKLMLSLINK